MVQVLVLVRLENSVKLTPSIRQQRRTTIGMYVCLYVCMVMYRLVVQNISCYNIYRLKDMDVESSSEKDY